MRRTGILLVLLGLALAIFSSLGVYQLMQERTAPTPTPMPTVKVVVAGQNIPERTILISSMVTVKDWPLAYLPVGAVTRPQDVIGKVTVAPLVAGELLLEGKVSVEAQAVGLAPAIPPGLVAVVLSLAPSNAVGGIVGEGEHVDVLVSVAYGVYDDKGNESKDQHTTFYTIQDIPVIRVTGQPMDTTAAATGVAAAAAARPQSSMTNSYMLTVLVTPQDALLLKYAREQGTIDVALRSSQFHEQVVTDPVYLNYIIRRFELPRPVIIYKETDPGEPK